MRRRTIAISTLAALLTGICLVGLATRLGPPIWRSNVPANATTALTSLVGAAGRVENASKEARVAFVPDGDTVRCFFQGRSIWVRLLRINTPEKDQWGYFEARELLRRLAGKKVVVLEFEDPNVQERDKHGRLLAYLFMGETNINVEIVRSGWSRFWTKYGAGRYAEDFRRAEAEARAAGRGLWARR